MRLGAALFLVLVVRCSPEVFAQEAAPASDHTPLPILTFLDHVERSANFEPAAKRFVRQAWERRPADEKPDSFLPEALAVLHPGFKSALDALGEERYAEAARLMHELTGSDDPYVSWHASVFELKALVHQDMTEQGQVLAANLSQHLEQLSKLTYLAGEVTYLAGYCQLQNLHYAEAYDTLDGFAERFPEAPERLRMMAAQMVREILARQEGGLGDVSDLMRYAGRELGHGQWGEPVTSKQERTVALLDKLIEAAEERENSARSGSSSGGRGSGAPGSQRQPGSHAQQSRAEGGKGRIGELHQAPAARPGEMWGKMRPAEREAVLQPIRESFPGRYLELIEQYYRELSK